MIRVLKLQNIQSLSTKVIKQSNSEFSTPRDPDAISTPKVS